MGTFKMFFVLWLTGSLVVPFVGGMEEGGNPGLYKEYRRFGGIWSGRCLEDGLHWRGS